jgi:hypothetical protein
MKTWNKAICLFLLFFTCSLFAQTGRSFVSLQQGPPLSGVFNKGGFVRRDADGVLSGNRYVVPSGKILVITDIDCDAVSTETTAPSLKLFSTSTNAPIPGTAFIADTNALITLNGQTNAFGKVPLSRTLISGIPVSSKARLWWQTSGNIANVRVKGYLVSDP